MSSSDPRTTASSSIFRANDRPPSAYSSTPVRERRSNTSASDRRPHSTGSDQCYFSSVFDNDGFCPASTSSSTPWAPAATSGARRSLCSTRRLCPSTRFCRQLVAFAVVSLLIIVACASFRDSCERRHQNALSSAFNDDAGPSGTRRQLASTNARGNPRRRKRARRSLRSQAPSSTPPATTTPNLTQAPTACQVDMPLLNVTVQQRADDVEKKTAGMTEAQLVWRRIVNTPGERLDSIHLTVMPFISGMQWRHGVFGSVGQLEDAGLGKLTSLLAQNLDVDAGERLFVADAFSDTDLSSVRQRSLSGMLSRYDVFKAHIRDVAGFDEDAVDPARRLVVYRRGIAELFQSHAQVALRDLPKFRLVVVGGHESSSSSASGLDALELAVCLIRDGGLIALDQSSAPILDSFFSRYGQTVVTPILSTGNLLYLTTTNFRGRYINYVGEADDWLLVHVGRPAVKTTTAAEGLVPREPGFEFLRL